MEEDQVTHHIELADIKLETGPHSEGSGQGCLLEWVSIFAGVDYGDSPSCTSPVLGAFGRSFNDGLDDVTRQRLVPFIPRLVGTSGDKAADEVRGWMATDWLVRTFTVAWLRKAGLTDRAGEVAALPELTSSALATSALVTIEKARKAAAGDAARDAAWAAAWAAASKKKGYDAQYKAARAVMDEALRETRDELAAIVFAMEQRRANITLASAASKLADAKAEQKRMKSYTAAQRQ
jgi:hypothetical protein